MTGWLLFVRLILRPMRREPIRTALTIFAVALGVGVVIAIDLAGRAAAGSFHSSLETLAGSSDLSISATGGVDEQLLGHLVQLPYAFEFSPRMEDFASINGRGEALPFIGIDLIGQEILRGESRSLPVTAVNPVWVGSRLGLHKGDSVRLLINDSIQAYTVAGVLPDAKNDLGENNAIVTDIGLAQLVTGKQGKLDAIDVSVPTGSVKSWRELLERELPPSVTVEPQGARTEENQKMLAAFRWNLRVLSYIALVVGAFLIYNTISISVVRRRNEIGIVRALGATRAMVANAFLAEAMFFGVTGSLLGLVLGRLMAIGAVRLIGSTVESLYVSSNPAPIQMSPATRLEGLAIGLFVSLLAALAPSLEASHVAPIEAMARGREEYMGRNRSRKLGVLGIAFLAAAAVSAQLPPVARQPIFGYVAVILLIAGTSVLIPNAVIFFAARASSTVRVLLGVEALLALRGLRASLNRTSVLTAALTTAVAMTASVGIMVGSFRETVWLWMDNQLKADLYLRPAGSAAADRHPTMSADIADRIEKLPGIATVDRFRAYPISYEGLPATFAGGETLKHEANARTRFLPGENRDAILRTLATGDYAIVSEPFANKHHIRPGDRLHIPLAGAVRDFRVLGIYYDYSTERGYVIVDRRTLLKYLPDRAVSNLAVYLKPNVDAGQIRREVDDIIGGRAVLVFSNATLRRGAIELFDRTFRITYALEAVAVVVAVMGIAGALLAVVIDRRRDFGLLRFLGAAQPQVRGIILAEAGLLGLLSNLIGLLLGTLLSLILIFVINKQSFGWTIQFHWPVALLLLALTGIYLATVLAGLYPARTAMRLNPIEVVHEA
ncbi:MAG TPA: FtsX-like permease family protein [Bryobacteraceae bacterium]|nr:FtsX-like permease family protein [Bryobacteraceae bacterium]